LSATGRVFAAFMPGRTIEPLLRRETQPVHGNGNGDASAHTAASARPTLAAFAHAAAAGHTPDPARGMRTWAQAQALLEEIRTQRLARAMGSPIPGVNAFSAPVHDASGQLALTITAMGAADDFDAAWDSPIAQRLRACAREIEYRLGAPDPAGGVAPGA
ncbi:MAG: IclR family transcriptional regulator C-terminal domain-containing protein, partial [Comamonadaceae bacterium]|nr:IclR family transcriptional regulator C-terminal domain-containing protein [Comamonadaceae bacterium]